MIFQAINVYQREESKMKFASFDVNNYVKQSDAVIAMSLLLEEKP